MLFSLHPFLPLFGPFRVILAGLLKKFITHLNTLVENLMLVEIPFFWTKTKFFDLILHFFEIIKPALKHLNSLFDFCMRIFYAIFSVNGSDVNSLSHFPANFAWNGLKNERKLGGFAVNFIPDGLKIFKERLHRRSDLIQWTLRDCFELKIEFLQIHFEVAALKLLICGLVNFLGPVVLLSSK